MKNNNKYRKTASASRAKSTPPSRNPDIVPPHLSPIKESPAEKSPIGNVEGDFLDHTPQLNDDTPEKFTVKNILSDIINSQEISSVIQNEPICEGDSLNTSVNSTLSETADTLKNVNTIKDELCKLALNPCESDYVINCITPLMTILFDLSTSSLNLATSVFYLNNSPLVHAKRSELKDTIHLVYKINDECDDVYDVLKKRIKILLDNECNE